MSGVLPHIYESNNKRMQISHSTPVQVPLKSPPELGPKFLRMNLRRPSFQRPKASRKFQQAPIANAATMARVRAASGRSSSPILSRNSGQLQAQDIEPEANDHGVADYMLNPDVTNPTCQSPAVCSPKAPKASDPSSPPRARDPSSPPGETAIEREMRLHFEKNASAAPSATTQPPLSLPARALRSPSPTPPPVATASNDVAATSADTRNSLAATHVLQEAAVVELTQLRAEQREAEAMTRKMAAELELVAVEHELRTKTAGILAKGYAEPDTPNRKRRSKQTKKAHQADEAAEAEECDAAMTKEAFQAEEKEAFQAEKEVFQAEKEAWPWQFMDNPARAEAESRLKGAMPWPWQAADPTKLRPAIEAAREAGVPKQRIILAAEVKLQQAIKKAEEDAIKEAENKLKAAMPLLFQRANSAKLKPAIEAAKASNVSEALLASAEAALQMRPQGATLDHTQKQNVRAADAALKATMPLPFKRADSEIRRIRRSTTQLTNVDVETKLVRLTFPRQGGDTPEAEGVATAAPLDRAHSSPLSPRINIPGLKSALTPTAKEHSHRATSTTITCTCTCDDQPCLRRALCRALCCATMRHAVPSRFSCRAPCRASPCFMPPRTDPLQVPRVTIPPEHFETFKSYNNTERRGCRCSRGRSWHCCAHSSSRARSSSWPAFWRPCWPATQSSCPR